MTSWEPLSDQQIAVLELERLDWSPRVRTTVGGIRPSGAVSRKAGVIRELLGITEVRYAQILDHVIGLPAAEVYNAQLVRRIRRVREERVARRGPRLPAAG